jgi:hypothetical protein
MFPPHWSLMEKLMGILVLFLGEYTILMKMGVVITLTEFLGFLIWCLVATGIFVFVWAKIRKVLR